ncbi:unnamed protein product [Mytilus edulis]|uniref:Uncharacterized protein n=1 Tax=Mytilus edulis TaxID=6550 RepID=A0A8S3VH92_MYTED|nr:unnamed protein product [Mytilus edulis]
MIGQQRLKFLQNGACPQMLAVAVLIVDNNLPLMTVFTEWFAAVLVDNNLRLTVFTEWCCWTTTQTSNDSFYRMVLLTPSNNGAADALKCLAVAVLMKWTTNSSGQQLTTSNDSFYRMVLPDALKRLTVAVLIVDNNLPQMIAFYRMNGAADALKCLAVAVLIVDKQLTSNDKWCYRRSQTLDCSSSNSGQQLTSNDSFLQNGAADALKCLAVAVLIVDNNSSNDSFCRMNCCSGSQTFGCSSSMVDNNLLLMIVFTEDRIAAGSSQTFGCPASSNSGQQHL